jgi:hypothetical protein
MSLNCSTNIFNPLFSKSESQIYISYFKENKHSVLQLTGRKSEWLRKWSLDPDQMISKSNTVS